AELCAGEVKRYQLRPRDFGLGDEDPKGLDGGDAQSNAEALRAVLSGARRGATRSSIMMSAAAALYAAGATGLRDGARLAEARIDDGAATRMLDRLIEATRA